MLKYEDKTEKLKNSYKIVLKTKQKVYKSTFFKLNYG